MHPEFLGQLVAQRRAQLEREAENARLLGQASRVRDTWRTSRRTRRPVPRRTERRTTRRRRAANRLLQRAARSRRSR